MNIKILSFFAIAALFLVITGNRAASSQGYSLSPMQASEESIDERRDDMNVSDIGVFDFDSKTVLLNSGYRMPIVGMGTYSLSHDVCVNSVVEHLKAGGRLIDTAFMYHNEKSVGKASGNPVSLVRKSSSSPSSTRTSTPMPKRP